jgi:hypothetical protein
MNDRGVCADYKFRGRAVNSYCAGDYSPNLVVNGGCSAPVIETAPALSTVQTTYNGCSVMFSWVKPTFSRNDIVRYNIQV